MQKIADFHIHTPYSRACSPLLTFPNLAQWAGRKGVDVIGTGDFTHPKWNAEISEKLQEQENGFLRLKEEFHGTDSRSRNVNFVLSTEISSIYSHNGRVRRIHNLLLAPSISVVSQIIAALEQRGAKLGSDGRPIVGLPSKRLLELVLQISDQIMFIPAHVWTPYFGLFGSMSGYDSVEECFEDLSPYIYALETGLSSDPEMFWRISKLDRFTLISCSDPHSLPRIGRECNVFDLAESEFSYSEIIRILRQKDKNKFVRTLEYFPEEGRYHYDGHRGCKISLHPSQTAKEKGICPKCAKPLTIGVLSRAEKLADRPAGFVPEGAIPGKHFVVLEEIIAAGMNKSVASKKVHDEHLRMTSERTEMEILFDLSEQDLAGITSQQITGAIMKMRAGDIQITPGYDGEYGKIKIFEENEVKEIQPQLI